MSEKRDKQIKQIAKELYPDDKDVDKYTAFMFGTIWADKNPASDNEWHSVSDKVDPTKDCIDKSNTIIYIDGDRDIFTITIGTIKDVYLTFDHFISIHNVCYWAYARAFVPNAIYGKLFQEAMEDNRDEE